MHPVTIVEIDIPYCGLVYGVSPCTAAIGVTGDIKCFNTLRTCQDRANFDRTMKTVRFSAGAHDQAWTKDGEPVTVIPSLRGVTTTPAMLNPGVDIGTRETVTITLEEHPHSDADFDKYLADRTYNPFTQGTFWAKLRARYVSFEGYPVRVLRGEYGQDLSDMRTYHYVVDKLTTNESVQIVAKDLLILTDAKKSQAPRLSRGTLTADIDADDMSFTLSPAGIGNLEYDTVGKAVLGGKELITFTRSGDAVTIVNRGAFNTEADSHEAGTTVQQVKEYLPSTVSSIVYDLLVNYTAGIDPAWIDLDEWEEEVDEYIDRLYEAIIPEPTATVTLINELIEQAGLILWWDSEAQQIRLRSLRPVTVTSAAYTDEVFVAGSFKAQEQPQKRISEIWTYFGVRNPVEKLDDTSNYQAAVATFDDNASIDYEAPAIKKVFSRWINVNNRSAAERLNSMQLARFRDAPRKINYSLPVSYPTEPQLGDNNLLESALIQDATGATASVPAQVITLERKDDGYIISAQESIFVPQDDAETTHLVYIDVDSYNVNLRTVHDSIYASFDPEEDIIRCIISPGVVVGSTSISVPAFNVGSWPDGTTIEIINHGRIQGKGGRGDGYTSSGPAEAGGTALYTREPISMDNTDGQMWGGGGGGGASVLSGDWAGGGGGAGTDYGLGGIGSTGPGSGGFRGDSEEGGLGGALSGSEGSFGGPGGDPGEAGTPRSLGEFRAGGAAGLGVDGESFVTYVATGSILGPRIN